MDQSPDRLVILKTEAEEFKKYLSGLPTEAYSEPSACDLWTVGDVLAHLGSQGFARSIARGLAGDISPPEGQPAVSEHNEDEFAERIAQRAFTTRQQQGDRLIEWFVDNLDESVRVFDMVGRDDWDTPCYWPPGPEPIHTLLDMRIAELSMHAWDVRSVLEPSYHLSDDSLTVLIETVPRAVRRAFRPEPDLETPIRYRFSLSSPASIKVDIVVATDGTRLEATGGSEPDVTYTCNGETYVLVMYGRVKPDSALSDGSMSFEGDPASATRFGQRFKGG